VARVNKGYAQFASCLGLATESISFEEVFEDLPHFHFGALKSSKAAFSTTGAHFCVCECLIRHFVKN
jgi:hypothetical protein